MAELTQLQQKIRTFLPDMDIRFHEPMSRHTSFRIGGAAEIMAFPGSAEELSTLLKTSELLDCKPAILGAGTNVLAPDEGCPGIVICLKDALDGMERIGDRKIRVMAGVSMTRAAVFAANSGLSGLEFAHGIPGTVGGGVYMDAGAYGGEIKQVAVKTEYLDFAGNLHSLEGEAQEFSYRHSACTGKPWIIVSCIFCLMPRPEAEIKATMQELMEKRRVSQPLDLPSAGSTFKRPVGGYAAALIDQAGLKGFRIGGAAVSSKHAGFVVNLGGATEADVLTLMEEIQKKVFETSGIWLEPEVVQL